MADSEFTGSPDDYPVAHIAALADETRALEATIQSVQRWRERIISDLRHAHERLRADLRWGAVEAARRIRDAIAEGNDDMAAALTVATIRAHHAAETTLESALAGHRP